MTGPSASLDTLRAAALELLDELGHGRRECGIRGYRPTKRRMREDILAPYVAAGYIELLPGDRYQLTEAGRLRYGHLAIRRETPTMREAVAA